MTSSSLKSVVDVYSGTYGFLQYNSTSNTPQDIVLYNEDGNEWIPAPKYFWKVVHNKETNEAVAFIGVNDPHSADEPEKFCTVSKV